MIVADTVRWPEHSPLYRNLWRCVQSSLELPQVASKRRLQWTGFSIVAGCTSENTKWRTPSMDSSNTLPQYDPSSDQHRICSVDAVASPTNDSCGVHNQVAATEDHRRIDEPSRWIKAQDAKTTYSMFDIALSDEERATIQAALDAVRASQEFSVARDTTPRQPLHSTLSLVHMRVFAPNSELLFLRLMRGGRRWAYSGGSNDMPVWFITRSYR
ncbi:hypothetical protein AC1031_003704 [Aphanomyces cochlioides]|nr:hypothetical protein AC1031_003704 [Aphanomyces cochlioides]